MEHLEGFEIPKEAFERLKDPEMIRRQISEGCTFQEILEYSQENMEKFYDAAYNLFRQEEYEKATDAFIFLTTLNPYVHSYWLGLGMAEQLLGEHQGALLAYSMAILTDMHNPIPHYHSATCYLAISDKPSAINSLKVALDCASKDHSHDDLHDHIVTLLERLS